MFYRTELSVSKESLLCDSSLAVDYILEINLANCQKK